LRVVVDHKVYLVEKSARIQTDYQAVRELKRQLESDGVQLDYNEWGGPGPYGLGVVKFKLL
jgi:enterochelin esterase-like enzyme